MSGATPPRPQSSAFRPEKIARGAPCAPFRPIYPFSRHILDMFHQGDHNVSSSFRGSSLCHGRHNGFGRGPFGWVGRGGGFGRREGRMFDGGELKLVILALVAEKPRHGYEIIRSSPSGLAAITRRARASSTRPHHARGDGPRLHEPGRAGPQALFRHARGRKAARRLEPQVDAIFARLGEREDALGRGGMGSVIRAMMNLRAATRLRLRSRSATPEQVQAIVDALDEAAKRIERI